MDQSFPVKQRAHCQAVKGKSAAYAGLSKLLESSVAKIWQAACISTQWLGESWGMPPPPSPPGKLVSEIAPEAIFGGFPSMLGYAYFC